MSRHHENVVWQSPDGTWNIGFHPEDHISCDSDCDDETHEWCREFDTTSFSWVSAGHATPQAAMASWDGANPGSHTTFTYDAADPRVVEWVAEYEDMAAVRCERAQRDAEEARAKGQRGALYGHTGTHLATSPGYWGYRGPAKRRTLVALARERNQVERANYAYRLRGDSAMPDQRLSALQARVNEAVRGSTPQEMEAYLATQQERRDGLDELLRTHREAEARRLRARSRSWSPYGYDRKAEERRRARITAEEAIETKIAEVDATREKQRQALTARDTTATATAKKTAGPQGRVAKGVPTGGQFAASSRAEAQVALTPPPADTGDYDPTDPFG